MVGSSRHLLDGAGSRVLQLVVVPMDDENRAVRGHTCGALVLRLLPDQLQLFDGILQDLTSMGDALIQSGDGRGHIRGITPPRVRQV